MPTYWSFFVTFFRIGLFTVGGGYVMLPMIEDEVVDKKKWINKGDFFSTFWPLPRLFRAFLP